MTKKSKPNAALKEQRRTALAARKAANAARNAVALQEVPSDVPRVLFKDSVLALVGCTYPAVWNWMREGKFPLAIDVGGKVAWRANEIAKWMEERPRRAFKPPGPDKQTAKLAKLKQQRRAAR